MDDSYRQQHASSKQSVLEKISEKTTTAGQEETKPQQSTKNHKLTIFDLPVGRTFKAKMEKGQEKRTYKIIANRKRRSVVIKDMESKKKFKIKA
jgi:hypothetical protein